VMNRLKLTRLMLRMNSDDDEGSSLVADDEALKLLSRLRLT
jgi:hypothetical protein